MMLPHLRLINQTRGAPNCGYLIENWNAIIPIIDACGFESYSLRCEECEEQLGGIIERRRWPVAARETGRFDLVFVTLKSLRDSRIGSCNPLSSGALCHSPDGALRETGTRFSAA